MSITGRDLRQRTLRFFDRVVDRVLGEDGEGAPQAMSHDGQAPAASGASAAAPDGPPAEEAGLPTHVAGAPANVTDPESPEAQSSKAEALEAEASEPESPEARPPKEAAATAKKSTAEDRQARAWARARKGVLRFVAGAPDGISHLSAMHTHSEQNYFIAHQSFSRLMEEMVSDGLLEWNSDEGTATITDEGRAAEQC